MNPLLLLWYKILSIIWPCRKIRKFYSNYLDMLNGKNNHLYIVWRGKKIDCPLRWLHYRFRLLFRHAQDSTITIHVPDKPHPKKYIRKVFSDITFRMGLQSTVEIQETSEVYASNSVVFFDDSPGSLIIGKHVGTWGACDVDLGTRFYISYGKVVIGDDCMISRGAVFRNSDVHTIYNEETRQILNPPADIIIGNRVWMAENVTLFKGARVADNSICAANALINKPFTEPGVILAGCPARVVTRGINWDWHYVGPLMYQYDLKNNIQNPAERPTVFLPENPDDLLSEGTVKK